MASTYLTRTPSSAGSTTKGTFSFWIKKSATTSDMYLWTNYANSTNWSAIGLNNSDQLYFYAESSGSAVANLKTNRLFIDTSAWYHIVVALDSTDGTADDRIKIYVNGVQETSFAQRTNPSSSGDLGISETVPMEIGRYGAGSAYFNGSMSYVAFVDGTAELPTIFGETDSVTGQWKIKTNITPSVAWGTNGFLILKNGNSLTDESTNSNNFTLGGGTLTDYKDCPSNVFSTMNYLANFGTQWALFENNNTYVRSAGTGEAFIASTLGIPPTSGKFYTEVKYTQGGSASNIGISGRMNPTAAGDYVGNKADSYAYRQNGEKKSDDVSSSYGDSYAPGDIIGIAVDATNSKIYFSKNGVWQNSGNPESGATGTGAAFTISTTPTDGFYFMACAKESGSDKNYYAWNFGNGFFQTSAVADNSTATASTPGVFNYAVPTGYQPLSTKGLNA